MNFKDKTISPTIWLLPQLSIMDRYLILELIPPFLFGMGIFSGIGLAVGSLFDLMRRAVEIGLPINIALQILFLKLPQFISYGFPTSVLLTTILTYSRLSSDSELTALRSCGISINRIIAPAIAFSLVITGIAFGFNEYIVPASNRQATITLNEAMKRPKMAFQERNIFYPEYVSIKGANGERIRSLKRLFYAEGYNGEEMTGLTILDWSQEGLNQILTAKSAKWNPTDSNWDFKDGTIYLISPDASYRNIVRFQDQQLQLPRAPLDIANQKREYDEMNINEAIQYYQYISLSGDAKALRKITIRIQQKISLPFACLVFALVGASLGNLPQRTSKATGFGISLLIVFAYYVLMSVGDAFGQSNYISPYLAAWLPNFFGIGAGIWLLSRSGR